MISRRTFIVGGAGAVLGGVFLGPGRSILDALLGVGGGSYVSGLKAENQAGEREYFFGHYDLLSNKMTAFRVPFRGHSVIQHPHEPDHFILFARKPGTVSARVRLFSNGTRVEIDLFEAGKGRHFYGHGDFAPDGLMFLCTETIAKSGRGKIAQCRNRC